MTDMEADIRIIKEQVKEISEKIDEIVYDREISSFMKLSDISLSKFLEEEPDIYSLKDLKVRY